MIKGFCRSACLSTPKRLSAALVSLTMLLLLSAAQADESSINPPLKVVIPPLEETASPHSVYFPRLLELALRKTEANHGPYVIESFDRHWTTARLFSDLKRGRNIDVLWRMTNPDLETDLIRIPLALLRGLNDHRVFLIREEDRQRFAAIDQLDQLRELKAGQGQHWLDTDVLRTNELPVVTSVHYELLFNMLAAGRFDYFPRGLHEVWNEYEQHKKKGVIIEQTLMLRYPAEMYFFVNVKDRALAERIEAGLKIANEDGSLDELFFSIPSFKRGHEEMLNPHRTILKLKLP